MKQAFKFDSYQPFAIGFLLLAPLLLRFINLGEMSFSNDELSALIRTRFPSFSILISQGVAPDGHPSGVQIFLWLWTNIAGESEWLIRAPFALFGGLSPLLVYFLCRKEFGFSAAFLAASALAFMEFPLLHSQLSRPYAPGLFFTLLCAISGKRLFGAGSNVKWYWIALYSISFAAAFYSHYFSALQVLVIACSFSILYQPGLKRIIGIHILCLLLILPHFATTVQQIKLGGLLWLTAPSFSLLSDFIWISLNQSFYVLLSLLIISVYGSSQRRKNRILPCLFDPSTFESYRKHPYDFP